MPSKFSTCTHLKRTGDICGQRCIGGICSKHTLPKFSSCTYLKRNGEICGQRCIGNVCSKHVHCATFVLCQMCGKCTQSVTGYCTAIGPCRTKQHTTLVRITRNAKRGPDKLEATEGDVLDTLVDDLLAEWPVCREDQTIDRSPQAV